MAERGVARHHYALRVRILMAQAIMRPDDGAETAVTVAPRARVAEFPAGRPFAMVEERRLGPVGRAEVMAVLLERGVVADADGAVVIPVALLDDMLATAPEQERAETWILGEVDRGAALPGLYPMDEATRRRYEAARRDG